MNTRKDGCGIRVQNFADGSTWRDQERRDEAQKPKQPAKQSGSSISGTRMGNASQKVTGKIAGTMRIGKRQRAVACAELRKKMERTILVLSQRHDQLPRLPPEVPLIPAPMHHQVLARTTTAAGGGRIQPLQAAAETAKTRTKAMDHLEAAAETAKIWTKARDHLEAAAETAKTWTKARDHEAAAETAKEGTKARDQGAGVDP